MCVRTEAIRRLRRFARNERGVQLAELAIVLPLFILLFATTAEFGRYFYEYTTLAKGTRAAVRYLATAHTDGTDDLAAKNLVVFGNMDGTGQPIISGLEISHVKIDRLDADGESQEGGVPATVGVRISGFKHTPIFDLGKLMKISSLSLNVDVKPGVTMHYLLTQPPT
jgi:TadE-like protein